MTESTVSPISQPSLEEENAFLRQEIISIRNQMVELQKEVTFLRAQNPAPPPISPVPTSFGEASPPEQAPVLPPTANIPPPTSLSPFPESPPVYPAHAPPQGYPVEAPSTPSFDVSTVRSVQSRDLDNLPYGLITLDAQGRVVHYNDTESRLAQLPKGRVEGKNFFQEIAPCTRLQAFEGRFRELVANPHRVRFQTFDFVFRFQHSTQHVSVLMTPARRHGLYNLALLRRQVTSATSL